MIRFRLPLAGALVLSSLTAVAQQPPAPAAPQLPDAARPAPMTAPPAAEPAPEASARAAREEAQQAQGAPRERPPVEQNAILPSAEGHSRTSAPTMTTDFTRERPQAPAQSPLPPAETKAGMPEQGAAAPAPGATAAAPAADRFGHKALRLPDRPQAASVQWRASDFIGARVHASDGHAIGKVDDIVLEAGGGIAGFDLSIGGVLGLGEREVSVGADGVRLSVIESEPVVVLPMTKDEAGRLPPRERIRR